MTAPARTPTEQSKDKYFSARVPLATLPQVKAPPHPPKLLPLPPADAPMIDLGRTGLVKAFHQYVKDSNGRPSHKCLYDGCHRDVELLCRCGEKPITNLLRAVRTEYQGKAKVINYEQPTNIIPTDHNFMKGMDGFAELGAICLDCKENQRSIAYCPGHYQEFLRAKAESKIGFSAEAERRVRAEEDSNQ